jgi:hypothetical protein
MSGIARRVPFAIRSPRDRDRSGANENSGRFFWTVSERPNDSNVQEFVAFFVFLGDDRLKSSCPIDRLLAFLYIHSV